jgi:hypothetical protein
MNSNGGLIVKRLLRLFAWVLLMLLPLDWALGAWCAANATSHWPEACFMLANIPCGGLYLWFESHWTGTRYMFGERSAGDLASLAMFMAVVIGQALVYAWIVGRLKTAKETPVTPEWLDGLWVMGGPVGFLIGILIFPLVWLKKKL